MSLPFFSSPFLLLFFSFFSLPSQHHITLATIQTIANMCQVKDHLAADNIFRVGGLGVCRDVILEGTVTINWGDAMGETLKPGECFGFDGMVDPLKRRYCSATAGSDVQVLPMNREHFPLALQEFPMFALECLEGMGDRLRREKEKIF